MLLHTFRSPQKFTFSPIILTNDASSCQGVRCFGAPASRSSDLLCVSFHHANELEVQEISTFQLQTSQSLLKCKFIQSLFKFKRYSNGILRTPEGCLLNVSPLVHTLDVNFPSSEKKIALLSYLFRASYFCLDQPGSSQPSIMEEDCP